LANLAKQLKKLLSENGCCFERHGKGDHDIWYSPITDRRFPVDQGVKSRHTAHGKRRTETSRTTESFLVIVVHFSGVLSEMLNA